MDIETKTQSRERAASYDSLDLAQLRGWLERAYRIVAHKALNPEPDLRMMGAAELIRQCMDVIDERALAE